MFGERVNLSANDEMIEYTNIHQRQSPVSYTHLDVYKRQEPLSDPHRAGDHLLDHIATVRDAMLRKGPAGHN